MIDATIVEKQNETKITFFCRSALRIDLNKSDLLAIYTSVPIEVEITLNWLVSIIGSTGKC